MIIWILILVCLLLLLLLILFIQSKRKDKKVKETSEKISSLLKLNSLVTIHTDYRHTFESKKEFQGNANRRYFNSYDGKDYLNYFSDRIHTAFSHKLQNLSDIEQYQRLVKDIDSLTITSKERIQSTELNESEYRKREHKLFRKEIRSFNEQPISLIIHVYYTSTTGQSTSHKDILFQENSFPDYGKKYPPTPLDFTVKDTLGDEKREEERKKQEELKRKEEERKKKEEEFRRQSEEEEKEDRRRTSEADIDGCHYLLSDDGSALLSSGKKAKGKLVLPKEITYKNCIWHVTAIMERAFEDNDTITEVMMNEELKLIGQEAFLNCSFLEKVTFPSSLQVIEKEAFKGCDALQEAKLKEGIKRIEERAFCLAPSLKTLYLPSSLEYVGKSIVWLSEKCILHFQSESTLKVCDEDFNADDNQLVFDD